ncbi:MAG: hypothetical protein ABF321_04885 [Bacteroidia bacterium]|nr:hypothetical protein [Bacteroidia bacterium]
MLIKHRHYDTAYRSISFEKEAYTYDRESTYLLKRKLWGMWRE